MTQVLDVAGIIDQLIPGLSVAEISAWIDWTRTQADYYEVTIGNSTCITKVYDQCDPPWYRVAQEVLWSGSGRDAVRTLHRGMDWARLQGATYYGYSLAPRLDLIRWRVL